ncbi:MAG: hypothetical protein M3220_00390, partial [Chloroflexota bacterium]|nr:hypothetical protein [Chloroflexota bacterium]
SQPDVTAPSRGATANMERAFDLGALGEAHEGVQAPKIDEDSVQRLVQALGLPRSVIEEMVDKLRD